MCVDGGRGCCSKVRHIFFLIQPIARQAMQKGRADSIGGPRTDHKGVPLQGQRCVPEPVQTIRPATLGIFSSSLGPLDIETLEKVQKRAVKAVSG